MNPKLRTCQRQAVTFNGGGCRYLATCSDCQGTPHLHTSQCTSISPESITDISHTSQYMLLKHNELTNRLILRPTFIMSRKMNMTPSATSRIQSSQVRRTYLCSHDWYPISWNRRKEVTRLGRTASPLGLNLLEQWMPTKGSSPVRPRHLGLPRPRRHQKHWRNEGRWRKSLVLFGCVTVRATLLS
jgi:hypothetical protein